MLHELTTIFYYEVTIFTKQHISNDKQFYNDVSRDVKYVPQFL